MRARVLASLRSATAACRGRHDLAVRRTLGDVVLGPRDPLGVELASDECHERGFIEASRLRGDSHVGDATV